jgi:hypothetical protein
MATKEEALKIVADYEALLDRALEITDHAPFYAAVDDDSVVSLGFEGDDAVLCWTEYDSDYYGGGHLESYSHKIPIDILLMDKNDFEILCAKFNAAEQERNQRLRAAQAAVERDRQERHERAVYAALKAKYDPPNSPAK